MAGMYLYLAPNLPPVESLKDTDYQIPLRIYSQDGEMIGEFGEKRRSPITFEEIPQPFIDAILSAEDDRFYAHGGVDIKGLLRAVTQLVQTGEIQGGGSTITMQVARNFFLTRDQVFTRKFNEILLALQIERELTKEEILSLYLNKIYLGNRAYGIQAAAQIYYGKNINELSLAQFAMIAGLPKAPSAYNPIANPSRALIRRDWILSRMRDLGHINQNQYAEAVAAPITAENHGSIITTDAPYVAEMARKEMINRYGLAAYTDGYQAFVTVDSRLQKSAEAAIINGLESYDVRHGYRGPETSFTPQAVGKELIALSTLAPKLETESEQASTAIDAGTERPSTDDETLVAFQSARYELEDWVAQLQALPTYADRYPAVITKVGDENLEALLGNNELIRLDKTQGLEKVRPFINENRRGPAYETLKEFLNPGDVIRVKRENDQWQFSQIPQAQGALIALDPKNGAIRAMVGGYDFGQSHYNRAVQATRQPGSNFKPFIYSIALENGYTPATVINDAPIVFDDANLEDTWRPENSTGKFYGPTRLRKALYNSRNLVSIRVLRSVGVSTTIKQLGKFGFNTRQFPHDLSLALGSSALTPLEVAAGYAILANGGYRVEPFLIERVLRDNQLIDLARPATVCDEQCLEQKQLAEAESQLNQEISEVKVEQDDPLYAQTLEESATEEAAALTEEELLQQPLPEAERVMDERTNYLINSMLRDVITRGTGSKAKVLKRSDLAGKTGTTNGPTDAWFSGYNASLVATTWLGFDQNQNLGTREFGGSAALPIWIDFMRDALAGVPEYLPRQPDGIVSVKINPDTGERALPGDPDAIFEVFREEMAPAAIEGNQGTSKVADSIEELF
ncbi:penicillin-binding protein 1A [Halioxenophilus aromaticivorans]|uniref:Penicillin-binding protein 1A n=1 Tax=Halioxenophilus aromaticivorans TaxID=1306992 RepID=A0AAV3TZZ4_9ALTE